MQIMLPSLPAEKFDLIVAPQHDKCEPTPNMIRIIGSLHHIENKIKTVRGSIKIRYSHLQKFIALMIGGDTKKHKFLSDEAVLLAQQISEISSNHGINVFISFSRRTSQKVKNIFRVILSP